MALPIPGIDNPKVLDSTSALALEALPQSILLLGGGVIGCEFASLFNALGVKVTVVEMMDRLAPLIEASDRRGLRLRVPEPGHQVTTSVPR